MAPLGSAHRRRGRGSAVLRLYIYCSQGHGSRTKRSRRLSCPSRSRRRHMGEAVLRAAALAALGAMEVLATAQQTVAPLRPWCRICQSSSWCAACTRWRSRRRCLPSCRPRESTQSRMLAAQGRRRSRSRPPTDNSRCTRRTAAHRTSHGSCRRSRRRGEDTQWGSGGEVAVEPAAEVVAPSARAGAKAASEARQETSAAQAEAVCAAASAAEMEAAWPAEAVEAGRWARRRRSSEGMSRRAN